MRYGRDFEVQCRRDSNQCGIEQADFCEGVREDTSIPIVEIPASTLKLMSVLMMKSIEL